jgi:hypothetical protein
VGVHEKGVSALESLLFAKYQMYRNVYWHHAVRSATAMFKRLVRHTIARGDLDPDWIAHSTDEALMEALRTMGDALVDRLRRRKLYKRAVDIPAAEVPGGAGEWIAAEPALVERVENRLAGELGLPAGALLLDFPAKPEMLAVELPVVTRGGRTARLSDDAAPGLLGLQKVAEELHTNARRLRLYAAEPVTLDIGAVLAVVERSPAEMDAELEAGRTLLAG